MYEKIKERYLRYYVTDAQLKRYAELGVLTNEQVATIKASRNSQGEGGGAF